MDVIVVQDAAELAAKAAAWLAGRAQAAVAARGAFHVALAGGTTPRQAHERWAALGDETPWDQVHIWFGDERAVPAEHADSNYRMARESLLDRVAIPAAHVHRLPADAADREAAARAYDVALPPALDLVVLGLGEDGHTASLFPGHAAALGERERRVLVITDSPKPPPVRLTLGPRAISGARERLVLAAGAGKSAVLARALTEPLDPTLLPIQLARGDGATWIIDRAAATELRS